MFMGDDPTSQLGPQDDAGVVAACRELHAAIDALDERAAKALGVSRNDLRCLNLLERGPVSPTQIAEALALTKGSVTTLIDRLERKSLVSRRSSPDDGRAVLVEATREAWTALANIYRPFGEALADLSRSYGDDRAQVVSEAVMEIAALCRTEAAKSHQMPSANR